MIVRHARTHNGLREFTVTIEEGDTPALCEAVGVMLGKFDSNPRSFANMLANGFHVDTIESVMANRPPFGPVLERVEINGVHAEHWKMTLTPFNAAKCKTDEPKRLATNPGTPAPR